MVDELRQATDLIEIFSALDKEARRKLLLVGEIMLALNSMPTDEKKPQAMA